MSVGCDTLHVDSRQLAPGSLLRLENTLITIWLGLQCPAGPMRGNRLHRVGGGVLPAPDL